MASHPFLAPQPYEVERVASVLPVAAVPEYVPDWPDDEIEFFRNGYDTWHSFSEREQMLGRIRKVKAARAVLNVLGIEHCLRCGGRQSPPGEAECAYCADNAPGTPARGV